MHTIKYTVPSLHNVPTPVLHNALIYTNVSLVCAWLICHTLRSSYSSKQALCTHPSPTQCPHLHKRKLGMCLVDLPHIKLLVLLQACVDLVGLVALGRAALHDVRYFQAPLFRVGAHLCDGSKDLVSDVLGSGTMVMIKWKLYSWFEYEVPKEWYKIMCMWKFKLYKSHRPEVYILEIVLQCIIKDSIWGVLPIHQRCY